MGQTRNFLPAIHPRVVDNHPFAPAESSASDVGALDSALDPAKFEKLSAVERLNHLEKALAKDAAPDETGSPPLETDRLGAWRRRYAAKPTPETSKIAPGPSRDEAASARARHAPQKTSGPSPLSRRALKSALGVAALALIGYFPLRQLLTTSSVEAIINARVITLRSPIEGVLEPTGASEPRGGVGAALAEGDAIFEVVDVRSDPSRLDDLKRQLAQTRDEQSGLVARLASRQARLATLRARADAFARGRVSQLEARLDEAEAEADIATIKAEESDERAGTFGAPVQGRSGFGGAGFRRRARLANRQAQRNGRAQTRRRREGRTRSLARRRLHRRRLQRPPAIPATRRRNSAGGRGFDDRDRQSYETNRALDRGGRRGTAALRDAFPRDDIGAVQRQHREMLASPGEQVHKGQDLLRVLDCSGANVTAVVSESVYNDLRIGSKATFRPRDGGPDIPGTVVSLTGSSGAPANFAIQPTALNREAYHVTVAAPGLANGRNCDVGRTGRVIFGPDQPSLWALGKLLP